MDVSEKINEVRDTLILAVDEDDVVTLKNLNLSIDDLMSFEHEGMNILNLAIEKEQKGILKHLANLLKNRPQDKQTLV